jgi:hypothetical protein
VALKPFLSSEEDAVYDDLRSLQIPDHEIRVYPKVRVMDALQVLGNPKKHVRTLDIAERHVVYSGHFDFLLQRVATNGSLVVEVDGLEHKIDNDQISRDLAKNAICEVYGMPLLRVDNSAMGPMYKSSDVLPSRRRTTILRSLVTYALFPELRVKEGEVRFRPSWLFQPERNPQRWFIVEYEYHLMEREYEFIAPVCDPNNGTYWAAFFGRLPEKRGEVFGVGRAYCVGISDVSSQSIAVEIAASEMREKCHAYGGGRDETAEAGFLREKLLGWGGSLERCEIHAWPR